MVRRQHFLPTARDITVTRHLLIHDLGDLQYWYECGVAVQNATVTHSKPRDRQEQTTSDKIGWKTSGGIKVFSRDSSAHFRLAVVLLPQ
jgi:hypothetical protein